MSIEQTWIYNPQPAELKAIYRGIASSLLYNRRLSVRVYEENTTGVQRVFQETLLTGKRVEDVLREHDQLQYDQIQVRSRKSSFVTDDPRWTEVTARHHDDVAEAQLSTVYAIHYEPAFDEEGCNAYGISKVPPGYMREAGSTHFMADLSQADGEMAAILEDEMRHITLVDMGLLHRVVALLHE